MGSQKYRHRNNNTSAVCFLPRYLVVGVVRYIGGTVFSDRNHLKENCTHCRFPSYEPDLTNIYTVPPLPEIEQEKQKTDRGETVVSAQIASSTNFSRRLEGAWTTRADLSFWFGFDLTFLTGRRHLLETFGQHTIVRRSLPNG